MILKQEQVTPCEVDLEIQADAEEVKAAIDKTYKEFGKHTSVPGFRKGKAPRNLLEKAVDKTRVREYVIDSILDDVYKKALEESGLEPFTTATVEMKEFDLDDPEFKFIVVARIPLSPKVELAEYKGLEFKKKVKTIRDDELDKEVLSLLKRTTPMDEVTDRPVQMGDTLNVTFAVLEDSNGVVAEPDNRPTTVSVGDNLPELDEGLVGMSIGETKEIAVQYPEDYEPKELRGTSGRFRFTVDKIQTQTLPELTDEWVKDYWEKNKSSDKTQESETPVDTVEKLKGQMRDYLQRTVDDISENALNNEIVGKVVETSKVDYPEAMLQAGINEKIRDLTERLKKNNLSIDDYLAYNNQTPEDYYEQLKESEIKSLTTGLVLSEIIEKEKIEVADEDIEVEIQDMAKSRNVPVETIRAFVENKNVTGDIRNRILQRKLLDSLKAFSNVTDEEVEEL